MKTHSEFMNKLDLVNQNIQEIREGLKPYYKGFIGDFGRDDFCLLLDKKVLEGDSADLIRMLVREQDLYSPMTVEVAQTWIDAHPFNGDNPDVLVAMAVAQKGRKSEDLFVLEMRRNPEEVALLIHCLGIMMDVVTADKTITPKKNPKLGL